MTIEAAILAPAGPRRRQTSRRSVRAGWDAARTTDENRRHWANADSLSANAALSPEVRRTIRNRARYEAANNSYAAGIVLTIANDVVGTGPTLQLATGDRGLDSHVEALWARWSRAVGLDAKLRTMMRSRKVDGEAFAILATNPRIAHPCQADLRLIECDRVTETSLASMLTGDGVDGIKLDGFGNPIEYSILRSHPGDSDVLGFGEADPFPAERVIHVFRADRPEQARGVSELAPALALFAYLRRFTLATVAAAEAAANIAGAIYTEAPAHCDDENAETIETGDLWELERGMFTALPAGYRMEQLKAEHPQSTYEVFVRSLLREIARCLQVPYNVAALDSSSHNYASGRLDHQEYDLQLLVERRELERTVLDRLLAEFVREVGLQDPVARPLLDLAHVPHEWRWPGRGHVDPTKEASAEATQLAANTTTLAAVYGRKGLDWESELEQRSRELARMRELGIPIPAPQGAAPQNAPRAEEDDAEDADTDRREPADRS